MDFVLPFSRTFLYKFIRFALVGVSGIFVDFGTTWILKEKFKIHKYIANSCGFLLATITNYLLNRYWTFQSNDPKAFQQFGKFFAIALVGLIFNNIIIYILNDRLKINFYLSKAFAIAAVSIWNFFANYIYTFAT
ncbi:glycosyl transferase family 2 [Pedobacter psychrophilus]|uniref:Glycosyl transferase family 2 n=1 Tax=Pedobacter psychrophilus TaxID=1826909 RepID=A0A179DHC6_9SPHI|nr:GtrA family protein [Pedobacter psychrophilus]OAQ40477.1 glycosyl transferase family 2 [Pedobacter psychrophilus]